MEHFLKQCKYSLNTFISPTPIGYKFRCYCGKPSKATNMETDMVSCAYSGCKQKFHSKCVAKSAGGKTKVFHCHKHRLLAEVSGGNSACPLCLAIPTPAKTVVCDQCQNTFCGCIAKYKNMQKKNFTCPKCIACPCMFRSKACSEMKSCSSCPNTFHPECVNGKIFKHQEIFKCWNCIDNCYRTNITFKSLMERAIVKAAAKKEKLKEAKALHEQSKREFIIDEQDGISKNKHIHHLSDSKNQSASKRAISEENLKLLSQNLNTVQSSSPSSSALAKPASQTKFVSNLFSSKKYSKLPLKKKKSKKKKRTTQSFMVAPNPAARKKQRRAKVAKQKQLN